jgi:hypothetical protein
VEIQAQPVPDADKVKAELVLAVRQHRRRIGKDLVVEQGHDRHLLLVIVLLILGGGLVEPVLFVVRRRDGLAVGAGVGFGNFLSLFIFFCCLVVFFLFFSVRGGVKSE